MSDIETRGLERAASEGSREDMLALARAKEREDGLATKLNWAVETMLRRANRKPPWGVLEADAMTAEDVAVSAQKVYRQALLDGLAFQCTIAARGPGEAVEAAFVLCAATGDSSLVEPFQVAIGITEVDVPTYKYVGPWPETDLVPVSTGHVQEGRAVSAVLGWIEATTRLEDWRFGETPLLWDTDGPGQSFYVLHEGKVERLVFDGDRVKVTPSGLPPGELPPGRSVSAGSFMPSIRRVVEALQFPNRVRTTAEVVRRWILLGEEGEIG